MLLAQFIEPELSVLYTVLLTTWLFTIGACVGSFLNVVVYRIPAGISIAYPPSHCPHCQRRIRRLDNTPIYSWIALGGKCRDCAAPISIRYLVVEVLVAVTFAILALFEGTTAGSNLPGTTEQFSSSSPTIWVIYGNHIFLLSTLWAIALIDFDRQVVPKQLVIPCLLIAAISMAMIPGFHPQDPGIDFNLHWRLNNMAVAVLGAATGGLLGWILEPLTRGSSAPEIHKGGLILAATLSGWVLGWQATLVLLLSTGLLLSIGICVRVLARGSLTITSDRAPTVPSWSPLAFPPTCWLIIVAPVVIITWNLWADWFPH